MASSADQPQRDFIERVRRTFLVGDDVPENLKEGALNLQTQLNNALRLLSEDLYSKKSHFVLELVQNADDNDYAKGVTPELTLDVRPDRLVLTNNEIGFSEENIGAICKVGASSKAKEKQHHIGEKGIGFKSVFSVSDAPEIHSNGYHFRFDRTDPENLLGYVIPTWCDVAPEALRGATTIVLPASPRYRFDASTLADLDARVLLFLNRLAQLTLVQQGGRCTYKRSEYKGVSHLTTSATSPNGEITEGRRRYVRVTKAFDMTEVSDDKRPDVETSSVVLAFPVESSGEAMLEPSSYVFAYLPIRQMGFRFPFHADFILNSGREEVLTDRPWNNRLRDSVATTFVAAVEQFKENEALGLSYLTYLPSTSEVPDGFFGVVRQQIVEGLSAIASLRSASGDWRLPSDLRIASAQFRLLFPSALAMDLFGFDYIDERVKGGFQLLRELGVDDVRCNVLIDVFRTKQEWLAEQPLHWRAQLYAYLAGNMAAWVKAGLLTVPCLPTADGKYVVPNAVQVFFPLGAGKKYDFEHQLTIIDDELYNAAVELSPNVQELFETLNVRRDDPHELVTAHILPKHLDDTWKQSSFRALVGHLRYIKDKLDAYIAGAEAKGQSRSTALQRLQDGLWLGTKLVSDEVWTFQRAANLYLAKEYKPEFCIETLLSGEPGADSFVSPDYLAKKAKDADAEAASWREFFQVLGVRILPAVVSSGADWRCSKELGLLLAADSAATRRQTLEWLDQHWSTYAPKMSYLTNGNRSRVATTFAGQLRATEAPLTGKRASTPLPETYYKTSELKQILGEDLPYIDAHLGEAMLDACGITFRLDAAALIKRLVQLKEKNGGTLSQIRAIYRALERHRSSAEDFVKEAFEDDGLIQLKGTHKGWYGPSQVSWRGGSKFIDSLYPPLEGQFKDFHAFFQDWLEIPRELPIAKLVNALTSLDTIADRAEREKEALTIYKRAEKALRPVFGRPVSRPNWMSVFEGEAVFVDHHGRLVEASESLLANDIPEIARLFQDEEDLSFIAVPREDVPRLSELLNASGVQLLSKSVEIEVEDWTEGAIESALTERVQRLVPYIARVLYAQHPAELEEAVEIGRIATLWNVEVVHVPELKQLVTLGDLNATTYADCAMAEGKILFRTKTSTLKDRIAAEISKYLVGTSELADTIFRLLLDEGHDDLEEVLQVRGIGPLPDDLAAAVLQRELPEDQATDESTQPAGSLDEDEICNEAEPEEPESSDQAGPDESSTAAVTSSPTGAAPTPAPPTTPPAPHTPAAPNAIPAPSTGTLPVAPTTTPPPPASGPVWGRPALGAPAPRPPQTTPSGQPPGSSPAGLPSGASPTFGRRGPWTTSPHAASGEPPSAPPSQLGRGTSRPVSSRPPEGRKKRRARTGRLLSYVEGPSDPNRPPSGGGEEQSGARDAVGRAAVAYAMATLAKRWAFMTEMPHNNPGYDLLAVTAAGVEEFIEVKGQGGAWTQEGVALTPTELLTAQRKGEHYWLCVVEFAQDEKRRQLSLVKNPFGMTQQFRFDAGWKAAAENIAGSPSVPDRGLYIEIAEVGLGRIISVRGKGRFFNIHVVLQGGKQANVVFNPAKMTLSEEPLWPE